MSPRHFLFVFLAVVVFGCFPKPKPEEVVQGWPLARKALTNGNECFGGRAEYCITDPDFVDAAIKVRLTEIYGGEMPLRKIDVDPIIRAAVNEYRRRMMKPENIARVEELVKERYDNPKVTTDGDEVVVDMGIVPGHIVPAVATLALRLTNSDLVDNGSWKEAEARRVLSTFATKYPDKPRVRVIATIVTSKGLETETYRYVRSEQRVIVYLGDRARTTARLDASVGALEKAPLSLDSMTLCKDKGGASDGPDCPPLETTPAPAE